MRVAFVLGLFYPCWMRYEVWRSRDNRLHVLCLDDRFEQLPQRVRSLGPWMGSGRGLVDRLRPHYRALLEEQGFVILHVSPYAMDLEGRYKGRQP